MVPIGILTQDRVTYLDATLRSLSATDLPDDTRLTIFDDGSEQEITQRYYQTNEEIKCELPWPTGPRWKDLGLDILTSPPVLPRGVRDKVPVVRLATESSLGVVQASCLAVRALFEQAPDAPGVVLLQDDFVFNRDWLPRMLEAVERRNAHKKDPVGVLAGMKLNSTFQFHKNQRSVASGITAQCLYITQEGWNRLKDKYFARAHKKRQKFDDTLCHAAKRQGLFVGCVTPFIGQHIGIKSRVRPGLGWHRHKRGRVGYHSHPPYVIAPEVRNFK